MSCTNGRTYIVKPKDIPDDIAQRELGDGSRWREIRKADGTPLTEENAPNLQVGQELN